MKKLKELTFEQLLAIQGEYFADNVLAGRDTDQYSNHVNRHVVRALADEKGDAFLGVFYPRFPEMPPLCTSGLRKRDEEHTGRNGPMYSPENWVSGRVGHSIPRSPVGSRLRPFAARPVAFAPASASVRRSPSSCCGGPSCRTLGFPAAVPPPAFRPRGFPQHRGTSAMQ